jgi:uncharacterized membrane protein
VLKGFAVQDQGQKQNQNQDEDRILRVWTPILLRTSVLTSAVLLATGLLVIALVDPGAYVVRYHQLEHGGVSFSRVQWRDLLAGDARERVRAILIVGLLVLTMVPLGRVAFTFFFFLKRRDLPFIVLTATVLILLIIGVVVGRVG